MIDTTTLAEAAIIDIMIILEVRVILVDIRMIGWTLDLPRLTMTFINIPIIATHSTIMGDTPTLNNHLELTMINQLVREVV
jgi:hypothetical protein